MTKQQLIRQIFYSTLVAGFTVALASPSAFAGFYRYPLQGYHKACADGSTIDIAIFPGIGYMHLSGSGNMMNAYPLNTLGWTPSLGGSSLCWTRPMSADSQESMSRSFYIYCVQQRRSYCQFN